MTARDLPPIPDVLLEEVAELSRAFGSDPEYTRGGGGNGSAKAAGVLAIKASGVSLGGVTAESLMPLDTAPLLAMLDRPGAAVPGTDEIMQVAMAARLRPTDERRPSVEFLFHALLPEPMVIHTHPTIVNSLTCAREGQAIAAELFGDRVLWIRYVDPGLPLAQRIAADRQAFETRTGVPAPRAMLLQNHGLIVTGDTAAEIRDRSAEVVDAIRERIGEAEDPAPVSPSGRDGLVDVLTASLRELVSANGGPTVIAFDGGPMARVLAGTELGRRLVTGGPLTPDQIVYAGSWPLWFDAPESDDPAAVRAALREAFERHAATTGVAPWTVVVGGVGSFSVGATERLAATAGEVLLDAMRIALGAERLGGLRPMAPEERRFIEEWEAETYRRGVEAAASGTG